MKTRLDETNKMRSLMGLSLLIEQGENPTSATTRDKIILTVEEGNKLEEELYNLMSSIEKASKDVKHEKEMVKKLNYELRSNKKVKRILRRKQKELEKKLEKIEELKNVGPVEKKKNIKGLGVMIGMAIIQGLGAIYMEAKSDNPIIPQIIKRLKGIIKGFRG